MPTTKTAPKKVRASILVTRWWQGSGGEINGESTERVSVPVARIMLVEPYTQEIWLSLVESKHGPGACRARLQLTGDETIAVTETVEEVDRLMNTPMGEVAPSEPSLIPSAPGHVLGFPIKPVTQP